MTGALTNADNNDGGMTTTNEEEDNNNDDDAIGESLARDQEASSSCNESKLWLWWWNALARQGQGQERALLLFVVLTTTVLLLAVPATRHVLVWGLLPLAWSLLLRVAGTAVGVGLGLGLAAHVYDRLELLQQPQPQPPKRRMPPKAAPVASSNKSSGWEESTSYASLMMSAGYDVLEKKRGQVVRSSEEVPYYQFTDSSKEDMRGPAVMQRTWPNLPAAINRQLGMWMEHILRDYIACWYSMVDGGCLYQDEKEKRQKQQKTTKMIKSASDPNIKEIANKLLCEKPLTLERSSTEPIQQHHNSSSSKLKDDEQDAAALLQNHHHHVAPRCMVWSTSIHRPIPFLNSMYSSLANVFGTLATRVENVNVFSLLLIKWTHVLSHSIRTYRELRKVALQKQQHAMLLENNGTKRAARTNNSNNNKANVAGSTKRGHHGSKKSLGGSSSSSITTTVPLEEELVTLSPKKKQEVPCEGGAAQETPAVVVDDDDEAIASLSTSTKNNVVSEIAVIKEFLLAGKLHRAITFGLDVPSLLFADPLAKECGVSPSSSFSNEEDELQVLQSRLFSSQLLYECELDYNRVLAHRIGRAILPRPEFQSNICRSMVIEMLAGCVLTPIMGTFTPDYINDWICRGLDGMNVSTEEEGGGVDATDATGLQDDDDDDDEISTSDLQGSAGEKRAPREEKKGAVNFVDSFSGTGIEIDLEQLMEEKEEDVDDACSVIAEDESEEENFDDLDDTTEQAAGNNDEEESEDDLKYSVIADDDDDDGDVEDTLFEENVDELGEAEEENVDELEEADESERISSQECGEGDEKDHVRTQQEESSSSLAADATDEATFSSGDDILTLLTMSLIDVQQYMDFDECRQARARNEEVDIDWDDAGCRDAVRQLVLVVEAALLHGARSSRRSTAAKPNGYTMLSTTDDEGGGGAAMLTEGTKVEAGDGPDEAVEVRYQRQHQPSSLSQVLMEMTSDVDAFEERVDEEEKEVGAQGGNNGNSSEDVEDSGSRKIHKPNATELSTLRTLIAAWLHTGQIYHTLSILTRSHTSVLIPFYDTHAFLRNPSNASGFVRQLRVIEGVEVLVDTMAVLASNSLDISAGGMMAQKDTERKETSSQPGSPTKTTTAGASKQTRSEEPAMLRSWSSNAFAEGNSDSQTARRPQLVAGQQSGKMTALAGSVKNQFRNNRQRLTRLVNAAGGDIMTSSSPPRLTTSAQSSTTVGDGGARSEVASLEAHIGSYPSTSTPTSSPRARAAVAASVHLHHGPSTPRYLDFRRNEAFASSLRSERERRLQSWAAASVSASVGGGHMIDVVCRTKGTSEREALLHRELHHVGRILYASTNMIAIRDATRTMVHSTGTEQSQMSPARESSTDTSTADAAGDKTPKVSPATANGSKLTIETASPRRRIEVPDDDSSFLLRAQPRPLNPVGIHRDQRNHDQSYKCYAATFEEPITHPKTNRYRGGRYIRRCLLRYFPNDRTASITLVDDVRLVDQRKNQPGVGGGASLKSSRTPFLPKDFQRERNLCQKSNAKGGSLLMNSVMEPSEFSSIPRTGKAVDFVYRMSLFERPSVELGGKKFTVHDSTAMGSHRGDASSLEMSDAALSVALLLYSQGEPLIGTNSSRSFGDSDTQSEPGSQPARTGSETSEAAPEHTSGVGGPKIEIGADGAPIVWMKFSTNRKRSSGGEKDQVEVRPYRTSYIRAALLITSARQEAQLQCLLKCVRAGSARSATKARTEALLQPTLTLLEFASSKKREKQSVILRDLKLGINHIDREQLRRNGLLNPRYPTELRGLTATVEDALQVKDTNMAEVLGSPSMTVFKVRCVALVALTDISDDDDDAAFPYSGDDDGTGKTKKLYREEWVILRPFRDFSTLHRHLKSQVAASETTAGAGARLVGAATAAFTVGGGSGGGQRQRKALIPSLGSANKAGALGVTKKSLERRREILDGYLKYILSPNHMLNQCSEILLFLGAFYPFPSEVKTGCGIVENLRDSLGRTEMVRTVFRPRGGIASAVGAGTITSSGSAHDTRERTSTAVSKKQGQRAHSDKHRSAKQSRKRSPQQVSALETDGAAGKGNLSTSRKGKRSQVIEMKASIRTKIDEVPLSQVRNSVFELVRYNFDLDNASFFRSRLFSALKTMSFAVTSAQEFRNMLYENHVKHVNGESLAEWIKFGLDMIWPDGVFYESSPDWTPEEKKALELKLKEMLLQAFPDQLRTVLGQEIAHDGLDILHEMFQNRLVVKSMAYMLMDLLWLEVFPELHDFLTGAAALDDD